MDNVSLSLYHRLARASSGSAFYGDLDYHARSYRRSTRAVGGYWTGGFQITAETMGRSDLQDFYDNMLGCRIVESTYGITSWEGYIIEMYLGQDGSTFKRSLAQNEFFNRLWVIYSDATGARIATARADNDDSQDEYGITTNVVSIGESKTAAAAALRDTYIAEYGWPRSREVGTVEVTENVGAVGDDVLQVVVAGYWHTMNWEYQIYSSVLGASALLTALIGDTAYITAGRIETNADSSVVNCYPLPRRRGDLVAGVINQGDSSGNRWRGGVYAGREFVYEQAETDWTYQKNGPHILDKAGATPVLSMVQPGFLMFNANAPTGSQPPGTSNVWDDPRYRYVEEVEYIAGDNGALDQLRLRFARDEEVTIIQNRIEAGAGAPVGARGPGRGITVSGTEQRAGLWPWP